MKTETEASVLSVPWLVSEIFDDGRPAVISETNAIVIGLGHTRVLCEHIVAAHNAMLAQSPAARAEGVGELSMEELSDVQTALMLVTAPIEIVDHRFMQEHGLITETEVYAVHPTSRLGERLEALQAKLTALRAMLEPQ